MANLRGLPSVDRLLQEIGEVPSVPRTLIRNEIRAVLQMRRDDLQRNGSTENGSVADLVRDRLHRLSEPSLRRVVNATGVVLHTNLGRAPLPQLASTEGYSNLEFDLDTGKRGKRDVHLSRLLQQLLERPAIVVNNNAAAVYLVLNELAAGHEVIVSRGELIEIGDGFRIPDIMLRAGVMLREVGTTNRTRISDFSDAITERTRLILRVHRSNFHMTGFTEQPALKELCSLGRQHAIPVYEDLGSGCFLDLKQQGIREPVIGDSFAAGVPLLSFSCDKLMGGPQAGIIAGDKEMVDRVRRNPMYRAFRVDKLIVQALETTLRSLLFEDWGKIPALNMILTPLQAIRSRAERVALQLAGLNCRIRETQSVIGGGSTPDASLPSWVIEFNVPDPAQFASSLRKQRVPVIARIEGDKLLLDMRTVAVEEESWLIETVMAAAV